MSLSPPGEGRLLSPPRGECECLNVSPGRGKSEDHPSLGERNVWMSVSPQERGIFKLSPTRGQE